MFNRSVPGFHQLDSDLLGRLCGAAEGDELADGISWSQTQESPQASHSGTTSVPAVVASTPAALAPGPGPDLASATAAPATAAPATAAPATAAPATHVSASVSDDEILPPSIEDASSAGLHSSQDVQDISQNSPVVSMVRQTRAASAPEHSTSSHHCSNLTATSTVHQASMTWSSELHTHHDECKSISRRIFCHTATITATASTSAATVAASSLTTAVTSSGTNPPRGGRLVSSVPQLEASPVPLPRLSPVLGTQRSPVLRPSRSPVLRPSRSPVLRPSRRLRPATEAAAPRRAGSKGAAAMSTDAPGPSKEALPAARSVPETQPSCPLADPAAGTSHSAGSSPVIERRRRGRRRTSSTSVASTRASAAASSSAAVKSADLEGDGATFPAKKQPSVTPLRGGLAAAAAAGQRGDDPTPLRAAGPSTVSPAVTRRSTVGASRRTGPVRQLFPAFQIPAAAPTSTTNRTAPSPHGSSTTHIPSASGTSKVPSATSRPGSDTDGEKKDREASGIKGDASRTDERHPDAATDSPRVTKEADTSRSRRRAEDRSEPTKRRRTLPSVDEELRRGLGQERELVPTVSSQERRRWLREVTGGHRTAPPPAASDRRAADFVRQIRRHDVTPEKTAEEPEMPTSGKKMPPKRRGLVQKLRRLLKRSGAFARMSRHKSVGLSDQGSLSVLAERCDRQPGAVVVRGRTADPCRPRPPAEPGGGTVQVLLASGTDLPAVTPGDTVTLHPPWQRLGLPDGVTVLLPIGGASVVSGPPPPPLGSVRLLEFSCPCPYDMALPARCLRPFPRVTSPSRLPIAQSHLTTVREAVTTDRPVDDTTVLAALGCGGDVVSTVDAVVLHVCQYRCPADSQTSEGPEEDWCWSLLVRDRAGTVAEVVVPAPLVRRHRPLVRTGGRLRLAGLVVRERTTSDQCPALASMVARLGGGADPGFTYILQALAGYSLLTELPEDPGPEAAVVPGPCSAGDTRGRAGPGQLPTSAGDLLYTVRDPSPSSEDDGETPGPSQWCYPTLATDGGGGGGGDGPSPPPVSPAAADGPSCRLDLAVRLLAVLDGAVLVLTAAGRPLRLALQADVLLMLAPGQTALLRHVWRRDGHLLMDRYSTVERRDRVTVAPPGTPPHPLAASAEPAQLVLVSGEVVGVDEQCASVWPACSVCGSDDLTETSSGQFCHFCCLPPPSTVTKMELKVEVVCAGLERCRVFVQLLQHTINTLLGRSAGDPEQEYELTSVLGHRLTSVSCVVTSRESYDISLHQVRL